MNILEICNSEYYQYIDASFVHNQAKALREEGHKVMVIIMTPFAKQGVANRFSFRTKTRTVDNVTLVYLRYLSLSKFGNKYFNRQSCLASIYLMLMNKITSFAPDIIVAHTIGSVRYAAKIGEKINVPVVGIAHGSDVNIPYFEGKKDVVKEACSDAEALIAVSTSLNNRLKECGVNCNVYTLLNGFENSNLYKSTEKVPDSWISVSHLIKQKHIDDTITAFEKWKQTRTNATLTIIGQGPEEGRLRDLCKSLRIEDSVFFLGQQSNQAVLDKLMASEYFVMVSYPEGLGIVYLEAMSSGCITLGTKGEGIEDIIKDGINGYLVDRNDIDMIVNKIDKCASDKKMMKKIQTEAIKTVQGLSWATNAQRMSIILEKCRGTR